MKKFSANYSNSNHNFVIQNIQSGQHKSKYLSSICIIKNILQRGKPTLMSTFLQESIGSIHKTEEFNNGYPLIDSTAPKWSRIIKGDVKGNFFPAQQFFDELVPKYLSEYQYIQQLLIPEILINEITQVDVKEFRGQQVDFYLPQAFLIIEIDGSQHIEAEDRIRDNHTKKYGIKTIRINVSDLNEENEVFLNKIQKIIDRIEAISSRQVDLKDNYPSLISLDDYALAYSIKPDLDNPYLKSTAVIRFQLIILELLESGLLSLDKDWSLELIERDVSGFAKLAIDDLLIWFEHILKLHKVSFSKPKFNIKKVKSLDKFSNDRSMVKIDFSLFRRYTDEFQEYPEVYFVRTGYLDEFMRFKQGKTKATIEPYDYFEVSTAKLINYKLKIGGKNSDEKSLLFLVWNLFLQTNSSLSFDNFSFLEGQLEIIISALARRSTLGLLPTGSGKSVCYQLCTILQPAVSLVISPIKSLMYDQKADLDISLFSRTNHITSDDDGEDKERILNDFGSGKYLFIYISPERFQNKKFREHFISVNQNFNIAYAVIDEIHCLSEWGHSFRTSYLNLADTINKYCNQFTYIGLTATASVNVIRDIRVELNIEPDNIKTPSNYTREELEFIVIDDKNDKDEVLIQLLNKLKNDIGALKVNGSDTRCGVIFTTALNGDKGCYMLSTYLSSHFESDIRYFSGEAPRDVKKANNGNTKIFDEEKKITQRDFKENKYSLLAATKAFGMGINKGNIHYTIHYGIPSSIEALYQEAGRAGRDKTKFIDIKAKCYVLLTKSSQVDAMKKIWEPGSMINELENIKVDGDLNIHHFMFVQGTRKIKEDLNIIKEIYELASPSRKKHLLEGSSLKSIITKKINGKKKEVKLTKKEIEQSLYRLKQLGVVKDWTISKWSGAGAFELEFSNYSDLSIKDSLLSTIGKYDKEFTFENIMSNDKYSTYKKIIKASERENTASIDQYIILLLYWSYDNFGNNRRQSLKNIYENTSQFADGEINSNEYKLRLENYFKFTQLTTKFQKIADNEYDFQYWFEVFYKANKFITLRQQEEERDSISRFLESYQDKTGLDLISGLIRLLLDDYDNSDGRRRLERSLQQIKDHHYPAEEQNYIVDEIIKIGKNCNESNKSFLAESLFDNIDSSKDFLFKLSLELQDSFSTYKLLTDINKKLTVINEENYDRLEKIG